jgi:hypothetical protein
MEVYYAILVNSPIRYYIAPSDYYIDQVNAIRNLTKSNIKIFKKYGERCVEIEKGMRELQPKSPSFFASKEVKNEYKTKISLFNKQMEDYKRELAKVVGDELVGNESSVNNQFTIKKIGRIWANRICIVPMLRTIDI